MGILSKRLSALAGMVKENSMVIDVGTDHGLIPVFLAQNGSCQRIIASDIKDGPLQSAVANAAAHGVSSCVEFMLSPGLEGVSAGDVDTVIIAGMGGQTIISVLSEATWIKAKDIKLILQPQTKLFELLHWLFENGFQISDAKLISEDGRIYTAFSAEISEETLAPDAFFDILLKNQDPLLDEYLTKLIAKLQKELNGKLSATTSADLAEIRALLKKLAHIKNLIPELHKEESSYDNCK